MGAGAPPCRVLLFGHAWAREPVPGTVSVVCTGTSISVILCIDLPSRQPPAVQVTSSRQYGSQSQLARFSQTYYFTRSRLLATSIYKQNRILLASSTIYTRSQYRQSSQQLPVVPVVYKPPVLATTGTTGTTITTKYSTTAQLNTKLINYWALRITFVSLRVREN